MLQEIARLPFSFLVLIPTMANIALIILAVSFGTLFLLILGFPPPYLYLSINFSIIIYSLYHISNSFYPLLYPPFTSLHTIFFSFFPFVFALDFLIPFQYFLSLLHIFSYTTFVLFPASGVLLYVLLVY